MRSLALLAVLAAFSLAGCGGPYASEVEGPVGRADDPGASDLPDRPTGPATMTATMRVTSLPADEVGTATGDPVNCFYMGPGEDDLVEVETVDVTFTWEAEAPGVGESLTAKVYSSLAPDKVTSITGPSPIEVHAVPTGAPLYLPLAIRVEPNGPLAVAQSVEVQARVTGYSGTLSVWPIACQS